MTTQSRRAFLRAAGAAGLVGLAAPGRLGGVTAPSAPVGVARCERYALRDVATALDAMLDQLGGLGPLVAGKTVAIKLGMPGRPNATVAGLPAGRTYHVHGAVAAALAHLLDRAGARRIRFLESPASQAPLEEFLLAGGWDLRALGSLRAPVEFENTRNLGRGARYVRVPVPWGGSLYPAYELNHSYVDCDVYISLAKLKNHTSAGVTLAMKNNFGITPLALYGQPEPDERSTSNRLEMFHDGQIRPAAGLPQEVDPRSPRRPGYRVARHIVDAVGIRPVDLALIDGIETVSGGEGPWHSGLVPRRPHLLIAGRNPVCTDAVAVACMGDDPMAPAGTGPFPGDNHLALAAGLGLGTHDPREIEVRGLSVAEARHPFGWRPSSRDR